MCYIIYKGIHTRIMLLLIVLLFCPGHRMDGQEVPDTLYYYLPGIVVTAVEAKGPGTISQLSASTIEHTQPVTLSDLSQLLPGGLTGNSGIGTPQYFMIREITLTNGYDNTNPNAARGTQLWVDGSPLYYNTEISSPYEGYDTRFVSLNQVEEAEVVRGIPSARYGNLTHGLVKLKTRQGEMPFSVSIRYNPNLKQYMVGKGFRISPQGHTLNLTGDYMSQGTFHTGGLRVANQYHWMPGGTPLDLNLLYTARAGKGKTFASEGDHTRSERMDQRLSLQSEWKPGRKGLQKLSLRIDGSWQRTWHNLHRVNSASRSLFTDKRENGEWEAYLLPFSYAFDLTNENVPIYLETELIASTSFPLREGSVLELNAGLSWRSEGNRGEGTDFDSRTPPAASVRPRSYREMPFLHAVNGFAEANYKGPHFQLQAGLRYMGLKSRDYAWIKKVEPRINLQWTPWLSDGYKWSLKAGAGLVGAMPTLDMLYPEEVFSAPVSFYYNDSQAGGYSLGIQTLHTSGEIRNRSLKPTVNRKLEAGMVWVSPFVNLDVTAFFEKQTNGFSSSSSSYVPFSYREYDYITTPGLQPIYRDGQVWVNGEAVPYREKYDYTSLTIVSNSLNRKKHGVEVVADFGTFAPLRTSLNISGAWLSVDEHTAALFSYYPTQYIDGEAYPYIGVYDKPYNKAGNQTRSEMISSNCRFITRIPQIGLVTTITWQMVWMYRERVYYNNGQESEVWPLYWHGMDGIIHPFTDTQKTDPAFAPLLSENAIQRFVQDQYAPYGMLNFRASKAFGRQFTLSFFANNFADLRPTRYSISGNSYHQQNSQPFFGLELQVRL